MGNLSEHAKTELQLAGLFDESGDFYGGMTGQAVMELIEVFEKQEHSGMSASLVVSLFEKLASFEPINPITGSDDEWSEYAENKFQNKRCSAVFKHGKNGQPFYIDAIAWKEEGGGSFMGTVEGITSRQSIKLPFVPKRFYVKVDKARGILDKEELAKALDYYDN